MKRAYLSPTLAVVAVGAATLIASSGGASSGSRPSANFMSNPSVGSASAAGGSSSSASAQPYDVWEHDK